jgi:outer membrane protein OmpA-like peptidoglycan-associated protein
MEETRSRVRCRMPWWVWLLPLLVAAPLAVLATSRIESALQRDVTNALFAASIDDVAVRTDGQDVVLVGPPARRGAARLTAERVSGIRSLRFEARAPESAEASDPGASTETQDTAADTVGSPATTGPTVDGSATTVADSAPASPTTPAAAIVPSVRAEVRGKQLTLAGTVSTQAQRDRVVNDATAAFGEGNVIDQLMVANTVTADDVDARVAAFARVLTTAATTIDRGSVTLTGADISVGGSAFTAEGKAILERVSGEVDATATIAAPETTVDPVEIQARLADLLGRSGINFESGETVITDASKVILDRAAESIVADFAATPSLVIEIGGHTDDRGEEADNQTLSEGRAAAVRDYLATRRVDADRLRVVGFGESRPIEDNATDAGRAANRRIEFTVSGS